MRPRDQPKSLGALSSIALASLVSPGDASAADVPARVVRVGYLTGGTFLPGMSAALIGQELAKLGYVEGKNLVIEPRQANGNPDRLPELAAEMAKLDVDVIYAVTNPAGFAAQAATR